MPPVNPAPGKGFIRTRPTPLVGDVLFYELRDRDVAANQSPPAYGTAHPDSRQWPNHKLVFVDPADQTGFERWWYAADRENQDNYNYEFTREDNRDLIVRTRVRPRSEATFSSPTLGSAFSRVPAAVFSGATEHKLVEHRVQQIDDERIRSMYVADILVYEKLPGEVLTTTVDQECFVYYEKTQRVLTSSPGSEPYAPEGSYLVESTLTQDPNNPLVSIWRARYEVLPSGEWTEVRTQGAAEQAITRKRVLTATPGLAPTAPSGYTNISTILRETENCLVSEWIVESEKLPGPVITNTFDQECFVYYEKTQRVLTSDPGTEPAAPAGSYIVESALIQDPNSPLVSVWKVRYEVLPSGDWTEVRTEGAAEKAVTRRRVQTSSTGTAPTAPTGYTNISTILRETENCLVSEWIVESEKLPGPIFESERREDDSNTIIIYRQRVLTDVPGTAPTGPSGWELISERLEATSNPLVSEWVVAVQKLPAEELAGFQYDPDSNTTLPFTTQVNNISILPTPTAAGTGIGVDGFVTEYEPVDQFRVKKIRKMVVPVGETNTYEVSDYVYNFPNVLRSLSFSPIARRDGGSQYRVVVDIQEGGSRICRATILEEWFATYPGQPTLPVTFVEKGFSFQGATLRFSVPACLHPGLVIYDNVGTEDPDFLQQSYSLYVGATNYTTIPATFIARVQQDKSRGGGWKRTTVTVQTPTDLV